MFDRMTKKARLAVAVSAVAAVSAIGWGWSVAADGGYDEAAGAAVEDGTIAPELVPFGSCGEGCTHQ